MIILKVFIVFGKMWVFSYYWAFDYNTMGEGRGGSLTQSMANSAYICVYFFVP